MKTIQKLFGCLILLLASLDAAAQSEWNPAGVWSGTLYNDTTQKYIPIEIAISYHNKTFSGYTYTVFLIDSVENIGVKAVTVKEKNNAWIIRDKKLIDDNYKDAPAKGVYTTIELQHSENDTSDILSGRWFTNRTKEFYPLTGTVTVTKRKNIFATRIIPRLQKLGLAQDLSFFSFTSDPGTVVKNEVRKTAEHKESKDTMMTIVEPEVVITIPKKTDGDLKLPDAESFKNVLKSDSTGMQQQSENNPLAQNEKKVQKNNDVKPGTVNEQEVKAAESAIRQIKQESKADGASETNGKQKVAATEMAEVRKQEVQKQNRDIKPVLPDEKKSSNAEITPSEKSAQKISNKEKAQSEINQTTNQVEVAKSGGNVPVEKITGVEKRKIEEKSLETGKPYRDISKEIAPAKIDLSNRKIETIRTVPVSGDSLVLSLFDNGAVDGDTVSVLLNGQVIISKAGLLTTAYNQTVHLTPEMGDSIKIVLYAENLGSIPPNTGLLVVRNAGIDYEIRFSGDLTKNSAIILLRNRKE